MLSYVTFKYLMRDHYRNPVVNPNLTSFLIKDYEPPGGGSGFERRIEVSAVDKVEYGKDTVEFAVLDVEAEVGGAASGSNVVGHHGVPRWVLLG